MTPDIHPCVYFFTHECLLVGCRVYKNTHACIILARVYFFKHTRLKIYFLDTNAFKQIHTSGSQTSNTTPDDDQLSPDGPVSRKNIVQMHIYIVFEQMYARV